MDYPIVSIIMPAFNAQQTINDAIESVLNQSYEHWELIVIDDGSYDNTAQIVESYQKQDNRILHVTLKKNRGLSHARNKGCKIAKGEYVAFLDSDDLWHFDKLSLQIRFHQLNPKIKISHTNYQAFFLQQKINRPWKYLIGGKKKGFIYPDICYINTIGILTVVIKKDLLDEIGFFDTSLWTMEDQDLWVRVAQGNQFGYLRRTLAYYRMSTGSLSASTAKYKRAYKSYIKKISTLTNVNPNLSWRAYYRYFGTLYFRKKSYRLCNLYFWKSIQYRPFDFIGITTVIYLLYASIREKIRA